MPCSDNSLNLPSSSSSPPLLMLFFLFLLSFCSFPVLEYRLAGKKGFLYLYDGRVPANYNHVCFYSLPLLYLYIYLYIHLYLYIYLYLFLFLYIYLHVSFLRLFLLFISSASLSLSLSLPCSGFYRVEEDENERKTDRLQQSEPIYYYVTYMPFFLSVFKLLP